MDLDDATRELLIVELSLGPASLRPDPAVVVAGVGRQNLAHPIRTEPDAAGMNEGDAFASRGVMDQRFRSLTQDLLLDAELFDLASLLAQFIAQLHGHGFKVTTARANSRHDHKACQKPTPHRASLPIRATIMTVPTRLHINRLNLRAGVKNRADSNDAAPTRRTVLDRVVSSYSPTIRALRYARQRAARSHPSDRALIVAMPTTPDLAPLDFVTAEAQTLTALFSQPTVLIEQDPESTSASTSAHATTPTRQRVLEELSRHTIAHFACHATHDASNPAQSRLLLHDHREAPLTVASLTQTNLEGAQLAFLSACETAVNMAGELLDESVHLTSAFQLAGFPHVIGTLWALNDGIGAEVATDFYTALRSEDGGAVEMTRAAFALHQAIRIQRSRYPRTPSLWAAHLHSGA